MNNVKRDPLISEILDRLKWFIRLRWIAILGTILPALFFQWFLNLHVFSPTLFLIIGAMLVCNISFWLIFRTKRITGFGSTKKLFTPSDFANLQIGLDLIFLLFLWHIYGGIENPIMFFFVFHMLIASMLLSKFNSYVWAVFSSLLLIITTFLDYFQILEHSSFMNTLTGVELWNNLYWILFHLSSFCVTLILVVYMTSSIAKRLRVRNQEIIALQKEIADKELEDAQKKLYFSEKMAALGKLAAGMAHEINNPLTTILTYSECLLDDVKKDSETENDLKTIIEETIRIREIVKKVLNFARSSNQTNKASLRINKELMDTVNMVKSQMDFINIKFNFNLAANMPSVKIVKEHLKQISINLLVNASQAMEGKGEISITTFVEQVSQTAIVKFSDTGPGIQPENINKIFDPFFTTKKQGVGTGLGLSVSYGLIKMYGGNISVTSQIGQGTTFIINLPLSHTEASK